MTNDAIRMTKKQCLEAQRNLTMARAKRLAGMSQDFPLGSYSQRMQTTEGLMQTLSDRHLKVLQHLEGQYGLDIRQMAARMLSEFTTVMPDLPNIFARMTSWQAIYETSPLMTRLNMLDRWMLEAYVATLASGGTINFKVSRGHKGVQITASNKTPPILP